MINSLQNQLMIELTMDLVFETVLVNPTLMSMLQLDAAAVTLMQNKLNGSIYTSEDRLIANRDL